jgi:hypothetical protein
MDTITKISTEILEDKLLGKKCICGERDCKSSTDVFHYFKVYLTQRRIKLTASKVQLDAYKLLMEKK